MKKGFTLIELLAVIIILSVITLITIPMITNVIEESKKKALASSVQGILDSTNYFTMSHETGVYEFLFDEEHQGSTINGEKLEYRGTIDGEGKLYIDKEGNTSICISNNNYYVYKNYNSGIIVGNRSKDNCNIEYDALMNKYVAFLESKGNRSNVYSKDEVNNLVDAKATELNNKITNNTNEITSIKSNIEELQNNLNNYALQSELEKTNTNVENLSSLVSSNQSNVTNLQTNVTKIKENLDGVGKIIKVGGDWKIYELFGMTHFSGYIYIPKCSAWTWIAPFTDIEKKPPVTYNFTAGNIALQLHANGLIQTAQEVPADTYVFVELSW